MAIGRLLAVGLTGNLIGAVISGVIGDVLGWRGVFFLIGAFGLLTAVIAFFAFRGMHAAKSKAVQPPCRGGRISQRVRRSPRQNVLQLGILRRHRYPRHVSLCGAVAVAGGLTHSSYAGLVVGGFGLGGIVLFAGAAVAVMRMTERTLMLAGAAVAAAAFILIAFNLAWYTEAAVFVLFGLGFYMLHNCIQVHVTELSQTARGAAMSMHSSAFFTGQAIGPIYYGFAFGPFRHSARRRWSAPP